MSDDEELFKKKAPSDRNKPGTSANTAKIDEIIAEDEHERKLRKTFDVIEERRKLLSGDIEALAAASIDVQLCVECEIDTKDSNYIVCEKCSKATHVECCQHMRFNNNGEYYCVNCENPKILAKNKIYSKLKSELAYFIANYVIDKHEPLDYTNLVHPSCECVDWPKDDAIDAFAFQFDDDKGESLTCLKCGILSEANKTVFCKGCLSLYHTKCVYDDQENELSCVVCQAIIASKLKLSESMKNMRKLDNKKRPMRTRENKSENNKVPQKPKLINSTQTPKVNDEESSDASDDESSQNNACLNVSETKRIRDELHKMQLNQILHKNLPPLFSFSQWDSFYRAYEETKRNFSASQNVERIKNAIKCATVKAWGKNRLFELDTYDERIQYINKTYNIPSMILRMELQKLTKRKRIASHEKARLVEFINDVDDYCTVQLKKGTEASRQDENTILAIIEVLPKEMAESFVNHVHNKNKILCIESLNEYLQNKMYGLIYNNPEILKIDESSNTEKSSSNDRNAHKNRERNVNFNSNTASIIGCSLCDDRRHTLFNCRQAWSLSGRELSKKLREKKICVVCGQEPYSGRDHNCSKPSNKFCNKQQHKDKKHYEILCALREPSNRNQNREQNYENNNTTRSGNSSSRGRGRGNGRANNNSRQNHTQNFLNQNNSSENAVAQNANQNNANVNSVAHNNPAPAHAQNNIALTNDQAFCTFLGKFFNMNKSEQVSWNTSETLLPVIVIKIGWQKVPVSFLLDTGSAISLIESEVAEYIQEIGQALPIRLNWSGDVNYYNRNDPNSRVISVQAEAFNKDETKRIMHFHTFKNLKLAPQTLDVEELQSRYQHLKELNLHKYKNIYGVIGQDQVNMFKILKQFSTFDGSEDSYMGYVSPMGDYVSGTRFSVASLYKCLTNRAQELRNNAQSLFTAKQNYVHKENAVDSNELQLLERRLLGEEYFEEPSPDDRANADDQYAISILEREMYKNENGKFVSPLIFKEENPTLPAFKSYCAAKKRHYALMAMLSKHDKFDEVKEEIDKMLSKGYCEKVPQSELRNYDMTFYLPIFCISPPNKRTRVIWDGRAECEEGKSLNSFLLPGPNLYNNLLQIYLNMRSEKVLIVGDLEEMFHQIVIKPEHRNALRFLWANDVNSEPEIYRMTRLVFGLNCAPFIAQYAVKLTADNIKTSQSEIASILKQDIYMDDIVTTAKSIADGQECVIKLKSCLSDAGFNLVKLKSSHIEVFDKLKSALTIEEINNEKLFPEGNMHRVLGYMNDFSNDTIGLGIRYEKFENFLNESIYPTKRDVLSISRSIYDPLGLFTFLTSKFKYIYHLICNEQLTWEDLIPENAYKLWKQALPWLTKTCEIRIPRCYIRASNENQVLQLWAFSDASGDAECVAIYIRLIDSERKQIGVSLILGKDFIIPKKNKRTIPELELDAATRAIMLIKDVVNFHTKIKFDEIYVAVDNTSVFTWLVYGVEKPSIYVKNRLNKIIEANQNVTFKWVPTDLQAADFGTKFSSLPDLTEINEWFYPNLFRLAEEDWISDQFLKKSENALTTVRVTEPKTIDWNRFSSLNRLIESIRKVGKTLAIKLREKRLAKLREKNDSDRANHIISRRDWKINSLKFEKIKNEIENLKNDPSFKRDETLSFILKELQGECYSEEIRTVASGVQLPLCHSLGKLYLCIIDGLLCSTSRIPENILREERFKNFKRHTIVLPKDHPVTKLIILQAHVDNNHFHINTVIAKLTKTYYIPHIRSTVIKVIKENCYLCRKFNRRPHAPLLGDLPIEKLCVDHSAFTNVMIDMAGPFMIKTRKTRNEATLKRYLLVVICLTTRAMHIEIMNDASSDSFIKALLITFELRGYPRKIICDRGTNFIGADNSLKKLLNEHNQERLSNGLTPHKFAFEFQFNPANSPHMQGSVERLIGNLKTAMNKMKKLMSEWSGNFDEPTFRFLVVSIVGMMNNRPLCTVQIKGTTSFLTPNSFIMNRENNSLCPPINPPENYGQLWASYLRIQKLLWEHFVDHCVPQWITREKWLKPTKNFEIGEIVLTLDHRKMNDWRLARVIDVEKGSNDQVRKLTLMLGKRQQNSIPKFDGKNFERFANSLYEKGKCYKVTRAAAHVIKLDLYCKEPTQIPNVETLEELQD